MSKKLISILGAIILTLSVAGLTFGQQTKTTTTTTVTKSVQNPDGTWTVVEFPVGKEVVVDLTPATTITGATGRATILRNPDGTTVRVNLTGIPADMALLNLYAVDPTGATTLLGPLTIENGVGTFATTNPLPLNKFMIIASPESNLAAFTPDAPVIFRSAVPTGFAVIPHTTMPVGEKVAATSTSGASSSYSVPMLNIPAYKRGDDTKLKINFTGALTGARANVFLTPRKDGPTEVRMRFHELKEAPAGSVYTLWAVSSDNKFVKLGQIVNAHGRNEAEIRSETALRDFGLLVTMENEVSAPVGPAIGIVEFIR
jgi:hypothetical protein